VTAEKDQVYFKNKTCSLGREDSIWEEGSRRWILNFFKVFRWDRRCGSS
jgi:hypothetical protein